MNEKTIVGGANDFGLDAGIHLPHRRLVRVLVVDDDPQAGALVEPALAEALFAVEVEIVSTTAAGLRRITADYHNIYLVDYSLPDGTGISLIREARSAGIDKPFLITGYGNETLDEAALREGAADYLEKDLIGRHLERSVRYALRDWRATQTLKQLYQDVWAASVRDPLTGCFNRKHAPETIERTRTSPGQPTQGTAVAYHVRPLSFQGRQRSLRASVWRCGVTGSRPRIDNRLAQ